jgi:seryl-tRNA synthetase
MVPNALKLWLAGSLVAAATLAASTEDNMAQSLMKLRAEVEKLNTQITDERDETKAQMRSLILEKNELDATIGREELKIKQLEQEIAKVKKAIATASKNSEGIKPVVVKAVADLKAHIEKEIPFKTQERLADVTRIEQQMNEGLITPQKALAQIWNSYADEIRMSKENGLFKQTIQLDGKDRLAEVARLGTVMMYFKTPDDRVGYVAQDQNGWFYKEVVSKEQKEQVLGLFDAMHKQIRTGYFTLPNAIAKSEVK